MTYEERRKWLCHDCGKDNCSYVNSSLESKCPFLDAVMYGWEFGYKDAIDKACEWLETHATEYEESPRTCDSCYSTSELVDAFRKHMEEQQ